MLEEMRSFKKNKTQGIVDLPKRKKFLIHKQIFTIKHQFR